jgi:hypothetical protein
MNRSKPMPAIEHLTTSAQSALRKGLAIPMLVEHCPPDMPDHVLTVIGLIDTRTFEGVFVPKDFSGGELVSLDIPGVDVELFKIKTDCEDARAVHELWTLWHGGVCERYLSLVRTIALRLSLAQLGQVLESARPVESAAGGPTEPGAKRPSKRRAAKGKHARPIDDRKKRGATKPRKGLAAGKR